MGGVFLFDLTRQESVAFVSVLVVTSDQPPCLPSLSSGSPPRSEFVRHLPKSCGILRSLLSSVCGEEACGVTWSVCVVEAMYLSSAKHQSGASTRWKSLYKARNTFASIPRHFLFHIQKQSLKAIRLSFGSISLPHIDSSKHVFPLEGEKDVTMKVFVITLAASVVAAAVTAAAAPTEAAPEAMEIFPGVADKDIQKHGYGCRVTGSD